MSPRWCNSGGQSDSLLRRVWNEVAFVRDLRNLGSNYAEDKLSRMMPRKVTTCRTCHVERFCQKSQSKFTFSCYDWPFQAVVPLPAGL